MVNVRSFRYLVFTAGEVFYLEFFLKDTGTPWAVICEMTETARQYLMRYRLNCPFAATQNNPPLFYINLASIELNHAWIYTTDSESFHC